MSFLNLMRNRLKPKEVNEALTEAVENLLPSVETTDEGKVLTVDSSGKWDAEDIPSQLPAVETTDEGKVLTVNSSGEWDAEEIPTQSQVVQVVDGTETAYNVVNGTYSESDGVITYNVTPAAGWEGMSATIGGIPANTLLAYLMVDIELKNIPDFRDDIKLWKVGVESGSITNYEAPDTILNNQSALPSTTTKQTIIIPFIPAQSNSLVLYTSKATTNCTFEISNTKIIAFANPTSVRTKKKKTK